MDLTKKDLTHINAFAKRSFRDVADQDYIAARMSHRANLREPFLWSSLQAFEKYFKAILLFNGHSAKGIGHKLHEGLQKVEAIRDIQFSIPDDVLKFIKYINCFGTNRYLEYSSVLEHDALLKLDKAIWYVRRFCYNMRGTSKKQNSKERDWFSCSVKMTTNPEYEKFPHKYQIPGGLLESLIKKGEEASKNLIWHNFYFGKRRKFLIKKHKSFMSSVNPTLTIHPEAFDVLDKFVKFSTKTRKHFKKS